MVIYLYVIPISVLILSAVAEWLHWRRTQKVAQLAFGPGRRPTLFGRVSPIIRVAMLTLLAWGLINLLALYPKVHRTTIKEVDPNKAQHLVLVLDVSPSMRIQDGGLDKSQSRLNRASEVVKSIFSRVSQDYLHLSIVATYNGALPVVVDTRDLELIDNMLNQLPMHHAFKSGKTKLFDGIQVACDISKDWKPNSTTLLLISDGETVPSDGMPRLPASISDVLVVGVGNPSEASFINGQQSRQDVATLSQIASRLGGTFHNAHTKHVPSDTLRQISSLSDDNDDSELSLREFSLIAVAVSTSVLALLPLFLYYFGSPWRVSSPYNHNHKTTTTS